MKTFSQEVREFRSEHAKPLSDPAAAISVPVTMFNRLVRAYLLEYSSSSRPAAAKPADIFE